MYNKIELLYKKKSPYNKIKVKIFWTYIGIVVGLLVFNLFNTYFMMILTVLITVVIMKYICEKELGTKLYFRFSKKGKTLTDIILDKENELFKNYLIENNMYNEKALNCLIEHYRNLIKPKVIGDNFWSIIAILASVILAFVTTDGFDFNSFEKAMPYLISFALIIIIIFTSIRQFSEIKTFLKGEDGIFESLESIFSELYVECLKELETDSKTNCGKRKVNKVKKQQIKK